MNEDENYFVAALIVYDDMDAMIANMPKRVEITDDIFEKGEVITFMGFEFTK